MKKPHIPSKFQQNIYNEIKNTKNSLGIQACAGSGKTTTIINCLDLISPNLDTIMLAFNRDIKEELKLRAPSHVTVSTLHGFGCRMIFMNLGSKIAVVENKVFNLGCKLFDSWKITIENKYSYVARVSKIVDFMRFNLCTEDDDLILEMAAEYGVNIFGEEIFHAKKLLETSNKKIHEQIDFVDMIYLPAVKNFKIKKYHYLFVDECLPYHIPVLLANGESKTIGEIVDNKLPLEVLSYNEISKKQEICKITGWSKTLNDKRAFKIKTVCSNLTCTYNHKIYSNFGWVETQYLMRGMFVQLNDGKEDIVVSVEEDKIIGDYVYDITVEKCHNFYANGILVHNCQDLNKAQQAMIFKMIQPKGGRLISVGDVNQSIYSFAGADSDAFENMMNLVPNMKRMPLSITYRLTKALTRHAQELVPDIEFHEDAEEGVAERNGDISEVRGKDFVVCRNTKPLIILYVYLLKKGVKVNILGKEIGNSINNLIDRTRQKTVEGMLKHLGVHRLKIKRKLLDKGVIKTDKHPQIIEYDEKVEIITILAERFSSVKLLKEFIDKVFLDKDVPGITLSTIHKTKGLEADRVFILLPNLIPSQYATTTKQLQQEQNLLYVARTRAKKELIYIRDFNLPKEKSNNIKVK